MYYVLRGKKTHVKKMDPNQNQKVFQRLLEGDQSVIILSVSFGRDRPCKSGRQNFYELQKNIFLVLACYVFKIFRSFSNPQKNWIHACDDKRDGNLFFFLI